VSRFSDLLLMLVLRTFHCPFQLRLASVIEHLHLPVNGFYRHNGITRLTCSI